MNWQVMIFASVILSVLLACPACSSNQEDQEAIEEIRSQIVDLGPEKIFIRSVKPETDPETTWGLTRDDYRRLIDTIPTIEAYTLLCERDATVINPRNDAEVERRLVGCTPEIFDFDQLTVARGRVLNQVDLADRASVCVLSKEISELFFPTEDPVGKLIVLPKHDLRLKVVGVLEKRNPRPEFVDQLAAREFSREIYVPFNWIKANLRAPDDATEEASFPHCELTQITIKVKNLDDVEATAEAIKSILKTNDAERNDVKIVVPYQILKEAREKLIR